MAVELTVAARRNPSRSPGSPRRPRAIVIGSGFGGLAAAIRLGARGYRVTVLEKLGALGGRARVHRQDGFTFDAGPTIITAPFLLEDLWTLCGRDMARDVDLRPVDPFYRIRFNDGETLDCTGDPQLMRERVARLSPGDVEGYERFMAASERICSVAFERLAHEPFGRWTDMARTVPDLLKLGAWRSVHSLVATFVRDPRLRQALSFHPLLIGGNPFRAPAVYALVPHLERRWGVHWAMGGTGRIVAGLAGLVEGQGGELRCGAPVAEIAVEKGAATGVRLESGERIDADIVVSNADSATTYHSLVPPSVPRRWTPARVDRARYSMSLFVWYFGTNRRFDAVDHHTIVLGPRYRDLLRDIFDAKTLAPDFSLYLHRPSATDPSVAPPGCDAFYVLAPVPHAQSGVDWEREAEPYRRAIAARLEETVMPGLSECIVTSRVTTPRDFAVDLSSHRGAAFGLEPTLLQSAFFRPHNMSADIKRLYLVGAGTHPGAGVPGVLSSARVLDKVVPHASAFV
jgi:phytoene desaturase